jgi:hypothetical protein
MAGVPRGNSLGANDLWLDSFVLFNFLCLSGDVALAHSENHFRVRAEYFPIWFSIFAATLLGAGLFARLRFLWLGVWRDIGYAAGCASIAMGAAGVLYHLESRFFYERTLKSLTYAAPFAAPLAYMGLGCLLVMNRMIEPRVTDWARWVLFFALGGFIGNFVLSLTDHAINGFFMWAEWIPVISSALAIGFLATLMAFDATRKLLWPTADVLFLQVLVGGLGFLLHVRADLHGPAANLFENVVSGAPPFAPLLLPNLSILGFLGIIAMARDTKQA